MTWNWMPVTVVMQPAGSALPQTIDSFMISDADIDAGDPVTLSWTTSNATAVRLNGVDVGANNYDSGSQVLYPAASLDYVLAVDGSVATKTSTLSCSVTPIGTPSGTLIVEAGSNTQQDVMWMGTVQLSDGSWTAPGYLGMMQGSGQNGVNSNGGMAFAPYLGQYGSIVVVGGGHYDWGGNECYAFDLYTMAWTRLSNPSTSAGFPTPGQTSGGPDDHTNLLDWSSTTKGHLPDGSPMTCHGFNVLNVIPGGTNSKGLLLRIAAPSLGIGGGGPSAPWVHVFDLGVSPPAAPTIAWKLHSTNSCAVCASSIPVPYFSTYDAQAGVVWGGYIGGYHSYLTKYDIAQHAYVNANGQPAPTLTGIASSNWGYMPTAAAHPVRGLMLYVAGWGNYNAQKTFGLRAVDLAQPTRGCITLATTGDSIPIANVSYYNGYPAPWSFDWDTNNDVGYIVCGDDDMTHVYRLEAPISGDVTSPSNPWKLTRVALPSALPSYYSWDAVYGRWRYCPSIRAFAYLCQAKQKIALWYP